MNGYGTGGKRMNASNQSYQFDNEVLKKALTTYGQRAQLDMVIEEMAELSKAICKLYRSGTRVDEGVAWFKMLDEAADVYIMLEQLSLMHSSHRNIIQSNINAKTNRLKERLEEA